MAINPSNLAAQPINTNYDVTIQMLPQRPAAGAFNATADVPHKLVGYYDGFTDSVELYIVDASGHRYLRIG